MRLNEFTKALTEPEKYDYSEEIWKLISHTYKDLGLYGANLNNLLNTAGIWEVELDDKKVIAGVLYRNFHGNKLRLIFHDGTTSGKNSVKKLVQKNIIHSKGYWGEFSGPLEKVLVNLGAKFISNKFAEKILGQKIDKLDDDGYHYYRLINGQLKQEVLIGHPNI